MTVRQVAESWKAEKRKYVKRSTMAAYTLSLHKHIMPEFGELGGIVEDDVQEFVLAKLRDGFMNILKPMAEKAEADHYVLTDKKVEA